MQRIVNGLADDPVSQKYNTVMDMAVKINFDAYVKELTVLHDSRKVKDLYLESVLHPQDLQKAILIDSAYRSRCVAIINDISYQQRLINIALETLTNHILSKYNTVLVENFSTVALRTTAVKTLLKTGYEKQEELNTIISMAQEIVKDIDQTSWQVRNLVNLIEIITSRENLVNSLS